MCDSAASIETFANWEAASTLDFCTADAGAMLAPTPISDAGDALEKNSTLDAWAKLDVNSRMGSSARPNTRRARTIQPRRAASAPLPAPGASP